MGVTKTVMPEGDRAMNKSTLFVLMLMLSLLVMVLSVSGAAAKAEFITAEGYEAQCKVLDPGKVWFDGDIMQVRGQISEYKAVTDNDLVGGINTADLNITLDLTTGNGTAWGKFKSIPWAYPNSSWEGSFNGRVVGWFYQGKGTGHGTGELSGMKFKTKTWEMPYDIDKIPADICAMQPATMMMNEYIILLPHGS